jgi:hypothetical protein
MKNVKKKEIKVDKMDVAKDEHLESLVMRKDKPRKERQMDEICKQMT